MIAETFRIESIYPVIISDLYSDGGVRQPVDCKRPAVLNI